MPALAELIKFYDISSQFLKDVDMYQHIRVYKFNVC